MLLTHKHTEQKLSRSRINALCTYKAFKCAVLIQRNDAHICIFTYDIHSSGMVNRKRFRAVNKVFRKDIRRNSGINLYLIICLIKNHYIGIAGISYIKQAVTAYKNTFGFIKSNRIAVNPDILFKLFNTLKLIV